MTDDDEMVGTFRRTLETLADNQGPHGEIPSNVDPESGRVSYGGMTGRVGADLWFIIGWGIVHWKAKGYFGFMKTILLCSDLDRTLIPNGDAPESPKARHAFRHLAAHPKIRLAYVSGRDKKLVQDAIKAFDLPEPDFVIGDVGTSLYHIVGGRWLPSEAWQDEIGRDWKIHDRDSIADLLAALDGNLLKPQPEEKQGRYKISFFTPPDVHWQPLKAKITDIFDEQGIWANLIWSRDDETNQGLLDILPPRANKQQSIRFLLDSENIDPSHTVFAGDSGNDMDALTSGLNAILVKNADDDVIETAKDQLFRKGKADMLYVATGMWGEMNGNYAAGVVEGMIHFFPETVQWMRSGMNRQFLGDHQ